MVAHKPVIFTRLADGTILLRQDDGSYQPVQTATDRAALAKLTEDEIEAMAANDPDHPALDDAFWSKVAALSADRQAISITLDDDVLAFFRRQGEGYETHINAVLRRYVDAQKQTNP